MTVLPEKPRRLAYIPYSAYGIYGFFAILILGLIGLMAVIGLFWTPRDPAHTFGALWASPSAEFWLGTDGSGRDIFSRLLIGARTTLFVMVGVGIVSAVIGVGLASLAAFTVSRVRPVFQLLIDLAIAFPGILLVLLLVTVFRAGLGTLIIALGIGFGVNLARVLRAEFAQVLGADYILMARITGVRPVQIFWWHLLPAALPVFLIQLSLIMGLAVLAESGLSYIGFGVPPETPSWGLILAETQGAITVYPLATVWPGLLMTLLVSAMYMLGDFLRIRLDPLARDKALNKAKRRGSAQPTVTPTEVQNA